MKLTVFMIKNTESPDVTRDVALDPLAQMNVASRVPTETLCEIFLLLCNSPIALHELNNKSLFHEFPWAVGQVCRHWRLVYLSYPALWSTLSFEEPQPQLQPHSADHTAEMNRRAAIYLNRSKCQPLTIVVRLSDRTSESVYTTIWGMLLSCSDRWKNANLRINSESMINGLFGRRTKMSILESLSFAIFNLQDYKYSTAFEIAPHLTKLNLEYGETREGTRGTLERWSFPWAQLTNLTIGLHFTDNDTFRTFLLQIRNVEELHLPFFFDNLRPGALKCPPVRFSQLKRFEFTLTASWMLSFFEAPVLEHLLVCDGFYMEEEDIYVEEISSFVQRSSCHIRRLSLRDCTANVAHDIMELLADVKELNIDQFADRQTIYIHYIIWNMADSTCLPDLRVLEVPCCPGYFDNVVLSTSFLLPARSGKSSLAFASPSVVRLERLVISVDHWDACCCGDCDTLDNGSEAIDMALRHMCLWPSFSVLYMNNDRRDCTLTVRALVAGAHRVDLFIHYPNDPNAYQYYSEQSYRHTRILESKRPPVISCFLTIIYNFGIGPTKFVASHGYPYIRLHKPSTRFLSPKYSSLLLNPKSKVNVHGLDVCIATRGCIQRPALKHSRKKALTSQGHTLRIRVRYQIAYIHQTARSCRRK